MSSVSIDYRLKSFDEGMFLDVPGVWRESCTSQEPALHQLSPYIGKIKSRIAADLIKTYTSPGDYVVDPFSGSGTIPLEALIAGRRAFGADISPYASILSLAKLSPPKSLEQALLIGEDLLKQMENEPAQDLTLVPEWVSAFFNPDTLCEVLRFAAICRRPGNEFFMACLLGILHHQRPGFLSYPSSHLVPYLRDKKYPREQFPEMYCYRPLAPRFLAKITRSYRRFPEFLQSKYEYQQNSIAEVNFPNRIHAVITSPPYMNALDYGRDNRLRLWLIDPKLVDSVDNDVTRSRIAFRDAMLILASKIEKRLSKSGVCIFIVGDAIQSGKGAHPSQEVLDAIIKNAPSLSLDHVMRDCIPDIRRARKECRGIKTEHFLIFKKK